MPISRRRLLSLALGSTVAARSYRYALPAAYAAASASTANPIALNPISLARFVDPLPIPPIARSTELRSSPDDPKLKLPYYHLQMREVETHLHRDLPATRQWSYNGTVPGPTIETRSGEGLLVEWSNALPTKHLFAVDHTIHGAESSKPDVRAIAHVHGAKVAPANDGYPEEWFAPGKSRTSFYPNAQDASLLWYHDHAMGITRLNVYAGLIGAFVIRDAHEDTLDLPKGDYEIPLILFDRTFDREGQLLYPTSGNPNAPWVSEMYGNTTLCNGKIFPYLEVEPRRYRIRVLNAANGRHFNLLLSNGQNFRQIGSDMGLLSQSMTLRSVTLYPAERADLIIDFSDQAGKEVRLKNFQDEIMSFRVSPTGIKDTSVVPAVLRDIPRMPESSAVLTRTLTLNDHGDHAGNSMRMLLNNMHWDMPVTEKPVIDTVEIWSLVNLTDDAHPIHLHLVRFQILDRRPFDLFTYNSTGEIRYTSAAVPPPENEAGWKDTVRTDAGTVTRIIIRFEGFVGRYVWHCHLLEHEDNEMMRPYEIVAAK
jgi:spore coat protein A